MTAPPLDDPRLTAAVDLISRTGAESFGMRYQDDEQPVVWIAIASYASGRHEVDASLSPVRAVLRLAERLVDGGQCQHCHRPAGLDPDSVDTMPLDKLVCWYQFDAGARKFIRGCA